MPVTTARDSGAVPDQVELVAGDQALADEHLVERRANGQHVGGGDQAFVRLVLVRSVFGRSCGPE